MNRNINVIVVSGVHVDCVEACARPIDDLQPLTLLHCQVDQDRPVWQVCKRLVKRSGAGLRAESECEKIINSNVLLLD